MAAVVKQIGNFRFSVSIEAFSTYTPAIEALVILRAQGITS